MKTKSLIIVMFLISFITPSGECQTAYESYNSGRVMLDQGMKNGDSVSIESSISLFDVAISGFTDPRQLASVYSKRAVAYGVLGSTDKAIEDFSESLALHDNLFERKMRGCMFVANGNEKKAREDFTKVCDRDPKSETCGWVDALDKGRLTDICQP